MVVYWGLFAVAALLGYTEESRQRLGQVGKRFLFVCLLVFVLMAFRQTGGDWYTYNLLSQRLEHLDYSQAQAYSEIGYITLNWLSVQVGWGIYGCNAACMLIFLVGMTKFCANERRPLLAMAVAVPYLVIVVAVGYTRQGTAIGFELLALRAIAERRPGKGVLLLLAAMAFHKSAIVLLPLLIFSFSSGSDSFMRAMRLAVAAAALGVAFFAVQDDSEAMYNVYVTAEHYSSQGAVIRGLMNFAAAAIVLSTWRRWSAIWDDVRIWLAFSAAALILVPLTVIASTAADRIGLYVLPLQVVAFSRLPELFPRSGKLTSMGVVALYTLSFYVWLHQGQFAQDLWLPYDSLLFGEIP